MNELKENKFMNWLQYTLGPNMQKLMSKPWLAGFSEGVVKCLPFILTGCLIFFYNAIRSWVAFLPDLGNITTYTFQMLALLAAFMITHQLMAQLHHRNYMVVGGLSAICAYILTMKGTIDADSIFSVDFNRFGPSGILVAMVVAIEVAFIFHMIAKVPFFKRGSSVPTFVQDWVKNMVPIFVTILVQSMLIINLDLDFYPIILGIFDPIQGIAQSLPGFVLLNWIQSFFFALGVSGWTWGGLTNAIWLPAQASNVAAVAAGGSALFYNTSEICSGIGLINLGGIGCTLALNFLFLFSKSKKLKTLGKVCIGPGLFNINEPILYGAPIVYNAILMIPFNLCTIVGSILTWCIFQFGLLTVPTIQLPNVGTLPCLVNTVMLTNDMRGIIWWIVLFLVYMVIWYPFFKVFEKQALEEELKIEKTGVTEKSEVKIEGVN